MKKKKSPGWIKSNEKYHVYSLVFGDVVFQQTQLFANIVKNVQTKMCFEMLFLFYSFSKLKITMILYHFEQLDMPGEHLNFKSPHKLPETTHIYIHTKGKRERKNVFWTGDYVDRNSAQSQCRSPTLTIAYFFLLVHLPTLWVFTVVAYERKWKRRVFCLNL